MLTIWGIWGVGLLFWVLLLKAAARGTVFQVRPESFKPIAAAQNARELEKRGNRFVFLVMAIWFLSWFFLFVNGARIQQVLLLKRGDYLISPSIGATLIGGMALFALMFVLVYAIAEVGLFYISPIYFVKVFAGSWGGPFRDIRKKGCQSVDALNAAFRAHFPVEFKMIPKFWGVLGPIIILGYSSCSFARPGAVVIHPFLPLPETVYAFNEIQEIRFEHGDIYQDRRSTNVDFKLWLVSRKAQKVDLLLPVPIGGRGGQGLICISALAEAVQFLRENGVALSSNNVSREALSVQPRWSVVYREMNHGHQ